MKQSSASDFRELLKARQLRPTAARQAVLERLVGSPQPVSPAQLYGEDLGSRFDRVTIYRTLAALRRVGLVHAVCGTDGAWRYRAHARPVADGRCPGNHPHFLCLCCGRMQCLPGQKLPRVQVLPSAAVQGKQLLAYGLCPTWARGARDARSVRRSGKASRANPRDTG